MLFESDFNFLVKPCRRFCAILDSSDTKAVRGFSVKTSVGASDSSGLPVATGIDTSEFSLSYTFTGLRLLVLTPEEFLLLWILGVYIFRWVLHYIFPPSTYPQTRTVWEVAQSERRWESNI